MMGQASERYFLPLKNAYGRLEHRDQRSLALLVVFLVVVGAWMGIWRPVEQKRDDMIAAYLDARTDLAWMRAHAGQVRPGHNVAHTNDGSLLSVVSDTAQNYRVVVSRAEPASDASLRLSLVGVSFARLLPWLDALEREHAIRVSQLSVEGQVGKPGYVIASLVLRRAEP